MNHHISLFYDSQLTKQDETCQVLRKRSPNVPATRDTISSIDLVPGDVVQLFESQVAPADMVLV